MYGTSYHTLVWYGPAAAATWGDDSTATVTADIQGWAQPAGALAGSSSVPTAAATRLKNSPANLSGAGTITGALPKGKARPTATINIGSTPSAQDVSEAMLVQNIHGLGITIGEALSLVTRILRNKTITDPSGGTVTVYGEDDTTPLLTADLFQDAAGTTPYAGSGAERRDRLE